MGTSHVRVPDPVKDVADRMVQDGEHETLGEAIRSVFEEAGYDV